MANTLTQWDPDIHISDTIKLYDLEVAFHRTIRVPDNSCENRLPPSMGHFPLFKVAEYAAKLPQGLAQKRGLFFPMFQREAMWISFSSQKKYAIKVFTGNVNAISGLPADKTAATYLRRRNLLRSGRTIQDYVVVPQQDWLDGFAVRPGQVRQFVAMPMGTGYSVESQVTGGDSVGGLQFEITRLDLPPNDTGNHGQRFSITISTLSGSRSRHTVHSGTLFDQLLLVAQKCQEDCQGHRIHKDNVRLVHDGRQMEVHLGATLGEYGLKDGDTIQIYPKLRGGGQPVYPEPEMGLVAGGLIKQSIAELKRGDYQKTDTVAFNVQILNSAAFQQLTGHAPPPTPVSAETYAKNNLPFFSVFEEPTNVAGDFFPVRSIGQLNGDVDPPLQFPLLDAKTGAPLASGTVGFLNPNGAKAYHAHSPLWGGGFNNASFQISGAVILKYSSSRSQTCS